MTKFIKMLNKFVRRTFLFLHTTIGALIVLLMFSLLVVGKLVVYPFWLILDIIDALWALPEDFDVFLAELRTDVVEYIEWGVK